MLDVPELARASRRPARRRPAHRRGRLPARAQLLDRVRARGAARDHRRAARRRRGLALPRRRAPAGRRARAARADRRLLRLGARPRRAAAPGRGRLGRRAAACRWLRHRARRRERRPGAPALLLAHARRRHLPGRARAARVGAPRLDVVHTLTREQPAGGPATRAGSTPSCSREVAWPASESPLAYVCGPDELRRGGGAGTRRARLRAGARSRPNDSERQEAADGATWTETRWPAARASVFGVEMTVAHGVCGECGGRARSRRSCLQPRAGHRRAMPGVRLRADARGARPRSRVAGPERAAHARGPVRLTQAAARPAAVAGRPSTWSSAVSAPSSSIFQPKTRRASASRA